MRPYNNLESKNPSDTYWRVQQVCMKAQVQFRFFKITTGIQSGPDAFDESRFIITFVTILGKVLCSFKIVLEGKTGNEVPESSR